MEVGSTHRNFAVYSIEVIGCILIEVCLAAPDPPDKTFDAYETGEGEHILGSVKVLLRALRLAFDP